MLFQDKKRKPEERVLKSIRLNDELCLALSGSTMLMIPILQTLSVPTDGVPHNRILQDWEDAKNEVDIGYGEAKRRIMSAVPRILRTPFADGKVGQAPGVLLVGHRLKGPVMCMWGDYAPSSATNIEPGTPNSELLPNCDGISCVGRVPEEGSDDRASVFSIATGNARIDGAEERLIQAVRFVSRWDKDKEASVGQVVSTRRMSNGFALQWHEEGGASA